VTVEAYPTPAALVPYSVQVALGANWELPQTTATDVTGLTWTAPATGIYIVRTDLTVNGSTAVAGDQWAHWQLLVAGVVQSLQPSEWSPGAYCMSGETWVISANAGDIVKVQGWKNGSGGHVYYSPSSTMTVTGYVPLGGVPAPVPPGGLAGSMLQKVSAADYNTQWGTAPLFCKATRQSAAQGITNVTWNRLGMDTLDDPSGLWSSTGFMLPAGVWHVWGHMSFMPSTAGSVRVLGLGDSSVTNRYSDTRRGPLPSASFDIGIEANSVLRFTTPTLVELWCYQDSGGTLNTFNNSAWNGHAALAAYRVPGL
jgi:hypothetical protein